MKKYWFSSDFHFSHANILHLCNRPFQNIYDHDRILIDNYNSLVSNEDIFYFLGDFAYRCSPERASKVIKRLNFAKMYFLFGNHEKPVRQAVQKGLLDDEIKSGKIEIIGGKIAIDDHTLAISKTIEIEGQKIFISHYGHRTWPSAFRGTWHLYGHSHNNLPPMYKSFDVGVDTFSEIHKRFTPYSLEEIFNIMSKIPSIFSEKEEV